MATVSIQVPMLETKLPVQTVANARCRKGRNGDTRFGWAGLVTRPGYPCRGPGGPPGWSPGGSGVGLPRPPPLLEGGPEEVERLGGAAHPRAVLGEGLLRGDGGAATIRGIEHVDRPGPLK